MDNTLVTQQDIMNNSAINKTMYSRNHNNHSISSVAPINHGIDSSDTKINHFDSSIYKTR